jgi:hypothetical protein
MVTMAGPMPIMQGGSASSLFAPGVGALRKIEAFR